MKKRIINNPPTKKTIVSRDEKDKSKFNKILLTAAIATIIATIIGIMQFFGNDKPISFYNSDKGTMNTIIGDKGTIIHSPITITNIDSTTTIIDQSPKYIKKLYPDILVDYYNVSFRKIRQDFGIEDDNYYWDDLNYPFLEEWVSDCRGYTYKLRDGEITFFDVDGKSQRIELLLYDSCKTSVRIPNLYLDVDTLKYSLGKSTFRDFYRTLEGTYNMPIEIHNSLQAGASQLIRTYTLIQFQILDNSIYSYLPFFVGVKDEYYKTKKELYPIKPNYLFFGH